MNTVNAARLRRMHLLALAGMSAATPLSVQADYDYYHHETAHFEACLKHVSKIKHANDLVKVEYLNVTREAIQASR